MLLLVALVMMFANLLLVQWSLKGWPTLAAEKSLLVRSVWAILILQPIFYAAACIALLYWCRRKSSEVLVDVVDVQNVNEESERHLRVIERAITQHRLHLDAQLNLERFAEHCGLRTREVSGLINVRYQKNFFEFINYHRVQTVKRRLLENPEANILDIALSSGFNSQSAFQRFFKRVEGVTPSEFRRRQVAEGVSA